MVSFGEIRTFCTRLANEYRPQRIVLFGSHAKGKARADSDVDLLVVMPLKGSGIVMGAEMVRKLRPSFGVDLIVRSPEDLARRLKRRDFFLLEATKEGKLLYEASDA